MKYFFNKTQAEFIANALDFYADYIQEHSDKDTTSPNHAREFANYLRTNKNC